MCRWIILANECKQSRNVHANRYETMKKNVYYVHHTHIHRFSRAKPSVGIVYAPCDSDVRCGFGSSTMHTIQYPSKFLRIAFDFNVHHDDDSIICQYFTMFCE